MLAHTFDRYYVVTKFILSTPSAINFSKFNFKDDYGYLRNRGKGHNHRIEEHILDHIDYCRKMKP